MVVLAEAIERTTRLGRLLLLEQAAGRPGYRRLLLDRFAGWTRNERPVDGPPPDDTPVSTEEWAIFGHYRAILRELKAEDEAGWTVWASRVMMAQPPPDLRKPGHVVAIDPTSLTRASWRVLDLCRQQARSMTVTLPFDPEPALAELYASIDPIRRQFLSWEFVETPEPTVGLSFRPPALKAIESDLFRNDAHERPKFRLNRDKGLKILGGPRGEGAGLLVAREVQAQIDLGTLPEEILILVPSMDGDAELIREALLSWGLPVEPECRQRLSTMPGISALRLALRLDVDDWPVSTLVPLLRNRQIRWSLLDQTAPFERFEAASTIQASRVFRNRSLLRETLGRLANDDPQKERSARLALRVLDQLSGVIDSIIGAGAGPWMVQLDRARRLAEALGLTPEELDPLWDALEDQGWVRMGLGPAIAEESWTWPEFVKQVDLTVAQLVRSPVSADSGTIRFCSVEAAEGVQARVIILANLAEKTFPRPDSVAETTLDRAVESAVESPNLAYSREMLRFARIAGSAGESLVLAYPMTDINGEPLLPAGFLDDLIRELDDTSTREIVEKHARFDPILIGHPELARSPGDARVLAVAQATRGQSDTLLTALARCPDHQDSLRGTADAFEVAHRRRVVPGFGPYDGRLDDPLAIAAIRDSFGPDHAFSPSQLESFALCPFQFYQRYVLALKMVDERGELDEDYAGRGSEVHRVLEKIHEQSSAEGAENLIERLNILIETEMRVELEDHSEHAANLPAVLREINTRRTNKTLGRYIRQFRNYLVQTEGMPTPHQFEVVFGQQKSAEDTASHPHLQIGEAAESIKLQGKIDRIDLIRGDDGKITFRVIDYKTGSNPTTKDVRDGLASQLPLYALAVERLVFPDQGYEFRDAGYWSLPRDGFKNVKISHWETYRHHLMEFVLSLVSELRAGTFPIESRKKDCRKHCDYQAACRVGEVRMSGKVWTARPSLGSEE